MTKLYFSKIPNFYLRCFTVCDNGKSIVSSSVIDCYNSTPVIPVGKSFIVKGLSRKKQKSPSYQNRRFINVFFPSLNKFSVISYADFNLFFINHVN